MVTNSMKVKAIIAAIIGYTFFGLSFLFSKVALECIAPFMLLSLRFIVAFFILNLFMLFGKNCRLHLKGKPLGKVLLLGIVHPLLYYTFENYGISKTSSAFAGTLLAMAPVVTLIAGIFFMREIPTRTQVFGAIFSFCGVIVISLAQQDGGNYISGIILLSLAVCSSVFYNLLTKDTSVQFTVFERTYMMIGMGCIGFTFISIIQEGNNWYAQAVSAISQAKVLTSLLYLGACASVGSFFLLNFSFTHLSLGSASIFSNLVTVVSIIAGVVVLKESFTLLQLIGSVVILIGVYISNRFPIKEATKE